MKFVNKNYYEILDIDPTASEEEIKRAYRTVRGTWKPDSIAIYSLYTADESEAIGHKIEEAFQILSSPDRRASYDRYLKTVSSLPKPMPTPETFWDLLHDGGEPADEGELLEDVTDLLAETAVEVEALEEERVLEASGDGRSFERPASDDRGGFEAHEALPDREGIGARGRSPAFGSAGIPARPAPHPPHTHRSTPASGTAPNRPAVPVAREPRAAVPMAPAAPAIKGGPQNWTPPPEAERASMRAEARPNERPDASRSEPSRPTTSRTDSSRSTSTGRGEASRGEGSRASGGSRSDVSRADVSRADVSRADVSRADVSRADVSRGDVSRADVSRADVSRGEQGRSAGGRGEGPERREERESRETTQGRSLEPSRTTASDPRFPNATPSWSRSYAQVVRPARPLPDRPVPREMLVELEQAHSIGGAFLRLVREYKGISLTDISERTKIQSTYLRYLEDERYGDLPPAVYVEGFVTQVARILKLDVDRVVAGYMANYGQPGPKEPDDF